MLSYESRSTKYINTEISYRGTADNKHPGIFEGEDRLWYVRFEVASDGKVIRRTRRKFWDDVSVRGGQYSALMLVLTAIYSLFQGPF